MTSSAGLAAAPIFGSMAASSGLEQQQQAHENVRLIDLSPSSAPVALAPMHTLQFPAHVPVMPTTVAPDIPIAAHGTAPLTAPNLQHLLGSYDESIGSSVHTPTNTPPPQRKLWRGVEYTVYSTPPP